MNKIINSFKPLRYFFVTGEEFEECVNYIVFVSRVSQLWGIKIGETPDYLALHGFITGLNHDY